MAVFKGKIDGDLTVNQGDDTSKVTSIGGSLYVRSGATCDLPVCASIGGSLYVSEGATCDLPVCASIGGSLYVRSGATCDLPVCTSIGGSLYVSEGATCDLPVCTSIGGYLDVSEGATCDLPVCTRIGGYLYVSEGATCDLPVCASIGGYLYVSEGATCDLPVCTSIGGYQLPDAETARSRLVAVAEAALADPSNLKMDSWHNESGRCGTSHCIAGWAVHLAGKEGYDLEDKVSQPMAGNILLGVEASRLFFLDNDKARSALNRVLRGEPALPAGGAV